MIDAVTGIKICHAVLSTAVHISLIVYVYPCGAPSKLLVLSIAVHVSVETSLWLQ